LDFARPRIAEFVRTDIKEIIEKTLDLLSRRLDTEKVKAKNDVKADIPDIHADPQQLQQVLLNLCSNALDAMPGGGILNICAELSSSESVALIVSDTGFGIDADDLSKIFQPFFSGRKRRGLGLGLAICDRIIKAHGGSIGVESRAGEGTRFTIHLPVKRGDPSETPASV
ncbi:MAG: sensor histidine kinase, partial [Candidatus Binatia bacterium]